MNLAALAGRFGTPCYVYDLADVRRAHAELLAALPAPSRLLYSVKANPHPAVIAELAALGCWAEVSSAGEIDAAAQAGVAADRMLLTGPGKSAADIGAALTAGVRLFSVDSPTDLARVGAAGTPIDCLLRVNADTPVPGMGLAMTGTASAFGVDASWVLRDPELFRRGGSARVVGLHLYMGTNLERADVLREQFAASIRLAARLRDALGVGLSIVDLGGGFGLPYAKSGARPSFGTLAGELVPLLDEWLPGWRVAAPLIAFESGRYLVGGAGTLVCQVLDVKASKGRTFVVLDSGIHHLGGMSGLRRLPRMVPELLPQHQAAETMDGCAVVGPLCTPLDTWSQNVRLPALAPGDLVAVPNVGAYGLTASLLGFLSHRPAVEVVIDGSAPVSASRLVINRGRC
jgi:diaminopimelate decarboxylase